MSILDVRYRGPAGNGELSADLTLNRPLPRYGGFTRFSPKISRLFTRLA
jgi:hypothetical protein